MIKPTIDLIKLSVISLLVSSCVKSEKVEQQTIIDPTKVIVLDSLAHPWSIAFLDDNNALITQKDGNLIKANLKKIPCFL